MTKPSDIPEEVRAEAWRIYFDRCDNAAKLAQNFEEDEVIDLLARALMSAEKREREAWQPAVVYFDRYCQDEADDAENCVCGEQQHEDAKAFAAIRNRTP